MDKCYTEENVIGESENVRKISKKRREFQF